MKYPVRCECGKVYHFEATLAGSRYTCSCGRVIAVPSLSQLKAAAGETALSPDVRVEQMLNLQMLPQETRCLLCGRTTTGVRWFWATCERAFVKKDPSQNLWILVLAWLFLGWLFVILLLLRARDDQVLGSDVQFRLPLRVCPECYPDLSGPATLQETVLAVPIYAELLDKYPTAGLALDVEKKGVDLSAKMQD